MASSSMVVQPPPAPPPSAALQRLSSLSSEQHQSGQAIELPQGISSSDHAKALTVPAQTTALVATHRPNTQQSTANNCLLPYIDPKSEAQSSPSAITNDLLPQDLLLSLKRQQGRALNPLSPPRGATKFPPRHTRNLSSPQTTLSPLKPQASGTNVLNRPPANVWNYPHRRTRLKHLTEAPPCVCGAGKDISFLYDSALLESEGGGGEKAKSNNYSTLPNTLVPEEYHIVKHPGVLGLEFHDEPFATRSEDHDHHMTMFPSMRPVGRHEVIALKHTLDAMLDRAGIMSDLKDADLKGPTEMHNLLELVQKEQAIYNICFHELIRQVSVQCVERGELLANIRKRYSNLLDRIPRQVKSLHDEVVAQRALDRKLTSELKKFKSKITVLTDELAGVREHDLEMTDQAKSAEEDLGNALADSEKNANLLAEYHALYELQRKRLEDQVSSLTTEKELWQQASYDLAHRVAEQCRLETIERLQLGEKAWCKLMGHFAVVLSDKDTQQLTEVQGYVQKWREQVVGVVSQMEKMEDVMRKKLTQLENDLQRWSEIEFKSIITPDAIQAPSKKVIERLWSDIKRWEVVVNEEAENFTGDILIGRQEEIKGLASLVESWTEVAVQLFTRHHVAENAEKSLENKRMLALNSAIETYHAQCRVRVGGENGVATGFVHLITPLETWDAKLGLLMSSIGKKSTLPDSDWIKLKILLKEWRELVHNLIGYIGSVDDHQTSTTALHSPSHSAPGSNGQANADQGSSNEENKDMTEVEEKEQIVQGDGEGEEEEDGNDGDVEADEVLSYEASPEVLKVEVEKWRSSLSYAIDSQDTETTEKVSDLHSSLVKWMVELLLAHTSTQVSQEDGLGHRQHIKSTANLTTDYDTLANEMSSFTKQLTRSCMDVVREIVDLRKREGYPHPDEEQLELKRMGEEADEWVKLAGLLIKDLHVAEEEEEGGKESEEQPPAKKEVEVTEKEDEKEKKSSKDKPSEEMSSESSEKKESDGGQELPETLPDEMSVIGVDDNIHPKSLQQAIEETEPPPVASSEDLGLATEQILPEGRGPQQRDAESLVIELDEVNKKLEKQELLTQQAEEKAQSTLKELEEAKSRITELEAELEQAKAAAEQREKNSGRSSRASGKGMGQKKSTRLSLGTTPTPTRSGGKR